jgi:hypothetical protein
MRRKNSKGNFDDFSYRKYAGWAAEKDGGPYRIEARF